MRIIVLLCALIMSIATARADILNDMRAAGIESANVRGYDAIFSYEVKDDLVIGMVVVHASRRPIATTAYHERCRPKNAGDKLCVRLEQEPSFHCEFSFFRHIDGTLLSGEATVTWHTADFGQLPPVKQGVNARWVSKNIYRLKFIGWDVRPWAYPAAGYELEYLPDGKKTFRVCLSLVKDKCITTDAVADR